jgi:hypothetical protein
VVILQSAFGTKGTAAAPFNLCRTATHEIGHWLNLNHIWGDDGTGCAGTDNVADTPNQAGYNVGAPTFPKVSCSNGPNGDMFMNYMDYVDDRAMVMFTAGQCARMQACLDGVRNAIGVDAAVAAVRPSSSPVVARGPNRLDAFVLGTDRALYHKAFNGAAWSPSLVGYENLGGVCTSVPQAVAWGANRRLRHRRRQRALSQSLERLGMVAVSDRLREHGGHLRWRSARRGVGAEPARRVRARNEPRDVPQMVGWRGVVPIPAGFENMGGACVGQPEVVSWGANRLDVFVIGTDRALYHKWWDGNAWGPSLTSSRWR